MGKLAAVALALALSSGVALAIGETASYMTPDGVTAHVQINGNPASIYRIHGEQPNGTYLLVAQGPLTGGHALRVVPISGPIDANPQFMIEILGQHPPVWIALSDDEYAFD